MKKSGKRMRWLQLLAVACLVVSCIGCGARDAGEAQASDDVLTPGIEVLAGRSDMAVATLCGNEYYFSRDVFARALNMSVSSLQSVTVVSLPGVEDGELMMGSLRVSAGQVIPASNLAMLSYVPADGSVPSEASFTFTPNEAGYEMVCNVYVLGELNYSPTVSIATAGALSVSTYRNYAGYGNLTAYDPEGDPLTFEIVTAPSHGLLIMTNAECGEYVYLPRRGYRGADSFRYVVRDMYGNYSAAAEVKVEVLESAVSVQYEDMQGRREYNAALTMAAAGIMQGTSLDGKTYFYPEATVSRLEFLTMAMQTIGVGSVPTVSDTGFEDDADIPAEAKGYVAAAYSLGYIKGSTDAEGNLCFLPGTTITKAEAAVILRRMVDVEASQLTPAFADSSDIPAWASEAISTLSAMGIMTSTGGAISPNEQLTRGQTAMMLAALRGAIEVK